MPDLQHPVLSPRFARHLTDGRDVGCLDRHDAEQLSGQLFSVERSLETVVPWIEYLVPLAGARVLVFGTGNGGTTVACATRGATVTGVDVSQAAIDTSVWRAVEYGVDDRCDLRWMPSTFPLPFDNDSFDLVLIADVIEHIVDERGKYVREAFRTLRPGGLMLVTGTPNLLYPKDFHTTGLYLVPWLPSQLAYRYAIWRGRWQPGQNLDYAGRRGATYWQILKWMRGQPFEILNTQAGFTSRYLETAARINSPRRRAFFGAYRTVERLMARRLGLPVTAVMPYINHLFIRKRDRSANVDPDRR